MNIVDPSPENVLKIIEGGHNLFITGPGGTGKSTIVRKIAELEGTAVTAMTGCAALLLDCKAKTLHSWAGIGLGKDSVEKIIENIKKKKYVKSRWTTSKRLIIDEVSMLTPEILELLDQIGRILRKKPNIPFGGLQLILVGDFCQLPPVTKDISGAELRFVFESDLWKKTIQTTILLKKIWRQPDPVYQTILNEVRMGSLSEKSEEILRSRMGIDWHADKIQPTLLFSRNYDVDKINEKNLAYLTNESRVFEVATIFDKTRLNGEFAPDNNSDIVGFAIKRLDNDATYMNPLELKIGAQVMLLTNMDQSEGLVNGSRGIIVDFEPLRGFPYVQFKSGKKKLIEPYQWWSHEMPHVGRQQIPLRIAYAVTIHKSQGSSIDSGLIDIGKNTFECGQAYVALSRVRSLEGLYIHAMDISRIRTHPKVLEFYGSLEAGSCDIIIDKPISSKWSIDCVHASWIPCLTKYLSSSDGKQLEQYVVERRANSKVYPQNDDVFRALELALKDVRVVILGQDPYHGPGQAMGLSFSVPDTVDAPPSLKNILKEVTSDIGKPCYHPNLSPWVKQGVLLLNTVLTVEAGKPGSHAGKGWEGLTDYIIKELVLKREGVIFLLWGKHAQKKKSLISDKHTVLESAHPSPLSAYAGFFGCKHFSKVNDLLGPTAAIQWTEK